MDHKTIRESLSRFLVATQKYTGLDHAYFLKSGGWSFLTFLVTQSANLVLVLFLVRVLSHTQYGLYQFVLASCAILEIFSIPQMKTPITKFVSEGHPGVFLRGTYDRLKISLSGSLVSVLLGGYFQLIARNAPLGNLFLVFAVLFPLIYSLDAFPVYMIGREQFGRRFRYLSLGELVIKGGAIAALLITRRVGPVLATTWALTAVVNLISFLLVRRELLALEPGPKITSYGFKLAAISLISILATQLDKLILAQYLGLQQLALFAVALLLPEQAKGVLKLSMAALAPRLKLAATKHRHQVSGIANGVEPEQHVAGDTGDNHPRPLRQPGSRQPERNQRKGQRPQRQHVA
ncbi:oligosaccharide flippase family protein [Acidimicrobium ferrooxidans]|nr:oligosaccharide flippase family protein [Acidimicrobium ferrooxidans]